MTQKVTTAREMKIGTKYNLSRQIPIVTSKLRISDEERWFGIFFHQLEVVEDP